MTGFDSAVGHNPSDVRTLREIQERAEKATAGPWYYDGRDILTRTERDDKPMGYLIIPLPETWHESQRVPSADAEFIAHARADIPWLLARIDSLTVDRASSSEPCSGGSDGTGKEPGDG